MRAGRLLPTVLRAPDGRPRFGSFCAFAAIGVILIALAWIDASGVLRFEDQLPALNLGIVGTAVALGSCALYLVLFRRSVRARVVLLRTQDTWDIAR